MRKQSRPQTIIGEIDRSPRPEQRWVAAHHGLVWQDLFGRHMGIRLPEFPTDYFGHLDVVRLEPLVELIHGCERAGIQADGIRHGCGLCERSCNG